MIDLDAIYRDLRANEPHAMDRLARAIQTLWYPFFLKGCSSPSDASDLTHDLFVKVVVSLDRFEPRHARSFRAWVTKIAFNMRRRYFASEQQRACTALSTGRFLGVAAEQTPSQALVLAQQRELLAAAIEALPTMYRRVMEETIAGRTTAEIARDEGVSLGAVRTRLTRARQQIRAWLREYTTVFLFDEADTPTPSS